MNNTCSRRKHYIELHEDLEITDLCVCVLQTRGCKPNWACKLIYKFVVEMKTKLDFGYLQVVCYRRSAALWGQINLSCNTNADPLSDIVNHIAVVGEVHPCDYNQHCAAPHVCLRRGTALWWQLNWIQLRAVREVQLCDYKTPDLHFYNGRGAALWLQAMSRIDRYMMHVC